ncbi:histidinol-phosphate transaminase [Sphingopyxis sp. SCN 67-31]|uniref:histidinol-phosphate transaminase n=1 Tax=Sphingopyxis sp. SCN 67-31 TaxID=1660142 RepID=UPI00086F37CE|nr:histidinol-phosphate transaminase [Sphingopyxis sp. SCN 67-31]ODU28544.1 MAG: histidinol-phosphate transaminase [Sphingopyxis sp. SCN 67-31]
MTDTTARLTPKPWISGIAPYVPGKSAGADGRPLVKLSANENPLGTGEKARAAFRAAATDADALSRYPDPGAAALREAIAAKFGLDPARVIYGTGSDDLLHLAAGAYAGPGDEILYVRYGFAVYEIAARRVGATPVEADDRDYATDVDALLARVTERTRVVYLANPNNPTGTLATREEVARLHAGLPRDVLLVIDQAYAEYLDRQQDDGGLELAKSAPNVFVTRTFSKIHGLAAERIGWGYASDEVIAALHRIRLPFNVTRCGQAAAIAALGDEDFVTASRTHNARWRTWLAQELDGFGNRGVRVVPSATNFLLVLFEGDVTAEAMYQRLMEAGYIVRWLPGQGLPHALRMTIGTEDETRGLAAAIRAALEG